MSEAATTDDTIVITGCGVLSPIGTTFAEFRSAVLDGRCAIRPQRRFSSDAYGACVAATLQDPRWDDMLRPGAPEHGPDPVALVAEIAAREAWNDARLGELPPARISIVLGTLAAGLGSLSASDRCDPADLARRDALTRRGEHAAVTAHVADALGITGSRWTVSTACASSAHAIAHACDLIGAGHADVALAGGADVLVQEIFAGFYAMDAMSRSPCAPFSAPAGMNVGEGAGFVVLERNSHARSRGIQAHALLLGHGLSQDAHHPMSPDPSGIGLARAIERALRSARIQATDVGYVNAHGTGTAANDLAEWRAISRALGKHADVTPVSSTKSYFGHAQGAAGVLELLATLVGLETQTVPPTLHFTVPRKPSPPDPVAADRPRAHAFATAIKINSAFGGSNAVLVLGRPAPMPDHAVADIVAEPDVWILGTGFVAAHGTQDFDGVLRAGRALCVPLERVSARALPQPAAVARVDARALDVVLRGVDPRGLDLSARLLTAAVATAMKDARIGDRGRSRERIGLISASTRPSPDSTAEYWQSVRERGYPRLSVHAFSRIVVNAAAGAVSRALSLKGPGSVLAVGNGGTLGGLLLAHSMFRSDPGMDGMLVGAVAALDEETLELLAFRGPCRATSAFAVYGADVVDSFPGEVACAVMLGAGATRESVAIARVAGVAASGPDGLEAAAREALQRASLPANEVDAVYGSAGCASEAARETAAMSAVLGARLVDTSWSNPVPLVGCSEANDGATLIAAVEAIRTGRAHPLFGASEINARRDGAPEVAIRNVVVVGSDASAGSVAVVLCGTRARAQRHA